MFLDGNSFTRESNLKEIENTITIIFEHNSNCEPNFRLIYATPNIGELIEFKDDINERGLFGKQSIQFEFGLFFR